MAGNDTSRNHSVTMTSLTLSCNIWSIMCNGVIVATTMKTKALRGYSGTLLINQAVADILLELSTVLIYIHIPLQAMIISPEVIRILTSLGLAFNGIVAYSIMAFGWNLYLAICEHLSYRRDMSWRKLARFILFSWLINLVLPFLHYTTNDFYVWDEGLHRLFPTYTRRNWWFGVICITNVTVVPVCVTVGLFCRVKKYVNTLPQIITNGQHSNTSKKIKLTLMNIVIMIFHVTSFLPLHFVQAGRVTTPGVSSVAALCFYSYHVVKVFLFMTFFKPFRKTIRSYCCKNDSHVTPRQSSLQNTTQMNSITSGVRQVSMRRQEAVPLRPHSLGQNTISITVV